MNGLETLLINGGDTRLALDARTGCNRYGCTPQPSPEVLSYGSSTAHSVSPEAFEVAAAEYHRLQAAACPERALNSRIEKLRESLLETLGLTGSGTEIVFSPSGTDSTLHALFLARALTGSRPLDCLLAASDETGSGVPMALSGRHFDTRTSAAIPVIPGDTISALGEGVRTISLSPAQ